MKNLFALTISVWFLLFSSASAHNLPIHYDEQYFEADGISWRLIVPSGYRLELLGEMDAPRMLTKTDNGVLLAGSSAGKLYQIAPPYDEVEVLAILSGFPHSVAIRGNELLVGNTNGVYRSSYSEQNDKPLRNGDFELVAALPGGGGHSSRTVAVGPDNKVYVSLGISGNCSDQYIGAGYEFENQRGGILVLSEQKGRSPEWQPYASGLRNPVGFDWHPQSRVMYASNNGPDHHGYELPLEYFSRVEAGSFHGMPWFWLNAHNKLVPDSCIGSPPRRDAKLPVATFSARSAPMGVRFIPSGALEKWMTGSAVVAIHGSWGTKPSGGYWGDRATRRPPQIELVYFHENEASETMLLLGGLQDDEGRRLARPMDIVFAADGTLYFTSDGGAVEGLFRLRRK